MKRFLLLLLLSTAISCKKKSDLQPESISGQWVGKGYECPTGTAIPEEIVEIVEDQGKITATKKTGDQCVPAGKVTFTGTYDEAKKIYNLKWTTGTPNSPASSTSTAGTLTVIDNNHLETTFSSNPSVTFTRKK
ncbi:hypothetical protein [Persicitalea sp.]|uniref:hypothetical protein n=1 Tax=Persicitalea sp. TaxID=3100273 RepID=UPI0035937B63